PRVTYDVSGQVLVSPVKADTARTGGLAARILPLVTAHKGDVAIAVNNLSSGEVFFFNAEAVMPTASLIKLPVMIEVYQQASSSRFELTDMLTLRAKDKVPGS